jgi:hypothetical protein
MVVRGSAWRAAIWTSCRSTPASSMVVTNVCLSICGWALATRIPAVCLVRWVVAHVDVPGEVSPESGYRAGVDAFEVGEQVHAQPVNLAGGFQ